MKKIISLDRSLVTGPYYVLCTSEAEFKRLLKNIGAPSDKTWLDDSSNGRTTTLVNYNTNHPFCIVSIREEYLLDEDKSLEVVSTLIHEAVHVIQEYMDYIGEDKPSAEFQAYAIQKVAHELIAEAGRRKDKLKKGKRGAKSKAKSKR